MWRHQTCLIRIFIHWDQLLPEQYNTVARRNTGHCPAHLKLMLLASNVIQHYCISQCWCASYDMAAIRQAIILVTKALLSHNNPFWLSASAASEFNSLYSYNGIPIKSPVVINVWPLHFFPMSLPVFHMLSQPACCFFLYSCTIFALVAIPDTKKSRISMVLISKHPCLCLNSSASSAMYM